MPEFPDILLYAAPFFGLSVLLEVLYVRLKKMDGAYTGKDAAASISMGVGNLVSDILMGAVSFGVLMLIWQFKLVDWGFSLWVLAACIIGQDFVYYYKHYLAHQVRWFWSAHVVHHSRTPVFRIKYQGNSTSGDTYTTASTPRNQSTAWSL